MEERKIRGVPADRVAQVPDEELLRMRADYKEKLHPFVTSVLQEDGYLSEILGNLDDNQRDAVTGVIEDHVAVRKYGRIVHERPLSYRWGPVIPRDPMDVKKDPLIEQYKRRLRKVGLENPEEYTNMLDTVADQIEIATRMDPFF